MSTHTAALVGCGDVATVHFEALDALGIRVLGVYDTHVPNAQATGRHTYHSFEELIDAHPDVIHITTPHDQHVGLAIYALDAGINVLMEKPLAHSLAEAEKLISHLEALGSRAPKIGVCYQNRYNVSSIELRRLLDSDELGAVRGCYASVVWTREPGYYTAKSWRGQRVRAGGGLLMNQAIHTLDLLHWLLGEVTTVSGAVTTDKYFDIVDVEDTAHAYLTHSSGVHTSFFGTLTASQHRPVEIELDCENAYVTLRDGLSVTWADGKIQRWEERCQQTEGRSYWGVSHELLINDYYRSLADPEPFWISPVEAYESLSIAQAIYASSQGHTKISTQGEES